MHDPKAEGTVDPLPDVVVRGADVLFPEKLVADGVSAPVGAKLAEELVPAFDIATAHAASPFGEIKQEGTKKNDLK